MKKRISIFWTPQPLARSRPYESTTENAEGTEKTVDTELLSLCSLWFIVGYDRAAEVL